MRKQSNSMSVLAFFMAFIAIGLFFAGMSRTVHADPPCNVCQDHDWITQEVATSNQTLDTIDEKMDMLDDTVDEVYAQVVLCVPAPCKGIAIPRTGQTTPSGARDDGELQKGAEWPIPRFTDNDDETVTDNLTGLMWMKDANLWVYQRLWSQALEHCNSYTGGGHDDWRLPNIGELHSLVHFGHYTPALPNTAGTGQWAEDDPFTNVVAAGYWSSTSNYEKFNDPASYAWRVIFDNGTVDGNHYKTWYSGYVWCVRDVE